MSGRTRSLGRILCLFAFASCRDDFIVYSYAKLNGRAISTTIELITDACAR